MAKLFIEVTDLDVERKTLINTDKIIAVDESGSGRAVVRFFDGRRFINFFCVETYTDVFNTLCEMELV